MISSKLHDRSHSNLVASIELSDTAFDRFIIFNEEAELLFDLLALQCAQIPECLLAIVTLERKILMRFHFPIEQQFVNRVLELLPSEIMRQQLFKILGQLWSDPTSLYIFSPP